MKKLTDEELKSMVNNGAKFLDKNHKGWYRKNRIKITTLNMYECKNCILGQLFGNNKYQYDGYYYAAYYVEGLRNDKERRQMGFTIFDNDDNEPNELKPFWIEEIKKRREKKHAKTIA